MDFFCISTRKIYSMKLMRRFIKEIKEIKLMDNFVHEYCLISLREDFNNDKHVFNFEKLEKKFEKFNAIIEDIEKIKNSLINLRTFKVKNLK